MQDNYCNYVVGFIDLLGQRQLYVDEPSLTQEFKDHETFKQKIKQTIGKIINLQIQTDNFLAATRERELIYPPNVTEEYIEKFKSFHSEMSKSDLQRQFWSDGIVYFSSLGNPDIKVPMIGVHNMLCAMGYNCFAGLALRQPLRGGIEIGWGVELEPGNLYGCAIAKAYDLESSVAQWPRVVVGHKLIDYLWANINNSEKSPKAEVNREIAKICFDLLIDDLDGYSIINYLGKAFIEYATPQEHYKLYLKAMEFVHDSLRQFKENKNTKLLLRYSQLLIYLESYGAKGQK